MPEPKHRLRIRAIDTVGFVDKGDDPDAEIVFFKRAAEEENEPMTEPETRNLLQKIYDAVTKNDEEPDRSGDDSTNEGEGTMPFDASELSDEAREHIEKLEAEVEELKAAAESDDDADAADDADPISDLPDEQRSAIEKRLAAQEERIAKAEKEAAEAREQAAIEKRERRLEVFRKQAREDLTAIQGTTDEIAEMLLAVQDNLDDDMAKRVTDALTAASAQVSENARLTSAIGKHGGDESPDGPWGQIEKAAKELRESNPDLTAEQARVRVMSDPANRKIVEEYRRQRQ